jgi:hypothetical protein
VPGRVHRTRAKADAMTFYWLLAVVMGTYTAVRLFSGVARGFGYTRIERDREPAAFWLYIAGYAAATLVLVLQAIFGAD